MGKMKQKLDQIFPSAARIISFYRRQPKLHLGLSWGFACLCGVVITLLTYQHRALGFGWLAAIWLMPFVAIGTAFSYCSPIYRSVNWFPKIVLIALNAGVMYFPVRQFMRGLEQDTASYGIDIAFWFVLWLVWRIAVQFAVWMNIKLRNNTVYQRAAKVVRYYTPMLPSGKTNEKLPLKRWILLAVCILLLVLSCACVITSYVIKEYFGDMQLVAILVTLKFANGDVSEIVRRIIMIAVLIAVLLCAVTAVMLYFRLRADRLCAKTLDRKKTFQLGESARQGRWLLPTFLLVLVISAAYMSKNVGVADFIRNRMTRSTIYEDYYVPPTADVLQFPEKKRNLIYIYLESYETSFTSRENGGNSDVDYMPELSALAKANVSFSNTEKLGGQLVIAPEFSYTMASTVAQTAGIAFGLVATQINEYQDHVVTEFLPGVTKLEDILHENGYQQLFLRGEDTEFAGYCNYVARYENSRLFDHSTAIEEGLIPPDYNELWGFEDEKMFAFARSKLAELAAGDVPFCLTLYTADTHGPENGFLCSQCDTSISDSFARTVRCTSHQVADFIAWLSEQDYFEDTVIILNGDHLAAISSDRTILAKDDDYVRTDYNCIINAAKTPVNVKNRTFCAMDFFPTTLSALGVTIKGDRLGLGTDLFSATPTLCEELGVETVSAEVQRDSDYFNTHFLEKEE